MENKLNLQFYLSNKIYLNPFTFIKNNFSFTFTSNHLCTQTVTLVLNWDWAKQYGHCLSSCFSFPLWTKASLTLHKMQHFGYFWTYFGNFGVKRHFGLSVSEGKKAIGNWENTHVPRVVFKQKLWYRLHTININESNSLTNLPLVRLKKLCLSKIKKEALKGIWP